MLEFTKIPIEFCKNLNIKSNLLNGTFGSPLASFELTLFKSVARGALLSKYSNSIFVHAGEHIMTRSVILKTDSLVLALEFKKQIENKHFQSHSEVNNLLYEVKEFSVLSSKHCRLKDFYCEIMGCLIFIRFSFSTGEAAGHNMTTKSADEIIKFILEKYKNFNLEYISVSGNICTDKKNSAINGILSRGRRIDAEILVCEKICKKILKTTPQKIAELNYYKNFIGSSLAGSIRSANSHFANIIAAFYLATGQDVANVVEGSQGFTSCHITEDNSLQFSISCPNIIIGSIGNGKNYDFIKKNIESIFQDKFSEENLAEKLAIILGATILCGEISLLASLTNQGDLMQSHIKYERFNKYTE